MNWLYSMFAPKPNWQQIIDNADLKTRCDACIEAAEDRFLTALDRHLRSVYGRDRVHRIAEHGWRIER